MLFVGLAAWSWRKWPDAFVDFGHELYIPWQLSEGRVLYRDIAYFMGPLSQYVNALAFTLFGASFTTLILVNLAILAAVTATLHRVFTMSLGRAAGLVAAATFLCVFAFSQYVGLGNYNYVTPYLHEQTHGVALGLILVLLLMHISTTPARTLVVAAGFTLGLAFLTKAEAFVPAAAAAAVAGGLLCAARRPQAKRAFAGVVLFTAAAAAPIVAAAALFCMAMPLGAALRAVAGNWVYLFDRSLVLHDPYYAHNLGIDGLSAELGQVVRATIRLAAFAGVAMALERALHRRGPAQSAAAGVLVGALLAATTTVDSWLDMARVLPVVSISAAAVFTWLCWRHRTGPRFREYFFLATWSTYSAASLGKMLLHARFGHYGFVLAMPGTLLLLAILLFVVPRALRDHGWAGTHWRAAATAATLVAVASLLHLSNCYYQLKTLAVGSGGDLFYVLDPRMDPRGAYFVAALEALEDATPADATLAVLPDGALLNFLLRRRNPTPYYLVTPWEMRAFGGEEAVFARIAPTPPDYVVLAKIDMSEYGPRFFGFDPAYGQRLRLWLEQNYTTEATVGHEPITDRPWLRIYKRLEGRAVSNDLPPLSLGS
jgi:hypothetical protein